MAVNGKLGTCTTSGATEGEKCNSVCTCSAGLLCAPNLLCKTCGTICQAEDLVNRLIQYYNMGCTCPPPKTTSTNVTIVKPTCKTFSATYKSPITLVNGIVEFPYF